MLQSGFSNLHQQHTRYTGSSSSSGIVQNEPASLPIIARGGVVARRPTDLSSAFTRCVLTNPNSAQGTQNLTSKVNSQSCYPPLSSCSSDTSYTAPPPISPVTSPDRTPVNTPSPRSTDRSQWLSAWNYADSPVSSNNLASSSQSQFYALSHSQSQSMSKSSLPRCAVVNFRRDGDVVRWTPRARENTGGMAARVRDFDDAFQLEELSSRTFGFSATRMQRGNAQDFDISGVLSAAVEAGMMAPAPPPPRRRHRNRFGFAVRIARVLRSSKPVHANVKQSPTPLSRTTAAAVTGTGNGKQICNDPTSRVSVSLADIGCVPMRQPGGGADVDSGEPAANRSVNMASSAVDSRMVSSRTKKYAGLKAFFWRRSAQRQRNEMALFDPETVMNGTPKNVRKIRSNWWTRSTSTNQQQQQQVHYEPQLHEDELNMDLNKHRHIHHVDQYIEFMDDF